MRQSKIGIYLDRLVALLDGFVIRVRKTRSSAKSALMIRDSESRLFLFSHFCKSFIKPTQ